LGLQQGAYAMATVPDWARVRAALEGSMGVRVRVVRASADSVSVRAGSIGGGANLWFADGRVEWEAPLDANPYFLAHLHDALVVVGANPLGAGEQASVHHGVRWRELPLRLRLAHGVVGHVARGILWLLALPVLAVAFVLANVFVFARRRLRKRPGR
jgi:prepilin-type processing-associated H-X9-DG protein